MDWCVVQVIQVLVKKVSLNEKIEGPQDGTKQSKKESAECWGVPERNSWWARAHSSEATIRVSPGAQRAKKFENLSFYARFEPIRTLLDMKL